MVVRTKPMTKYTAKRKRRRTANTTRIKYQAPTARNQRKQIMTNASAIRRLYQVAMPARIYCDWQYIGRVNAKIDPSGAYTTSWQAFPLMDIPNWRACLRQDLNVQDSSTTTINRLVVNLGYYLDLSNWCNFNMWIVTPRKDAADRDPTADIAAGLTPVQYVDYIEGINAYNLRLNPALYKVHFFSNYQRYTLREGIILVIIQT